jgi:hypothetical protein
MSAGFMLNLSTVEWVDKPTQNCGALFVDWDGKPWPRSRRIHCLFDALMGKYDQHHPNNSVEHLYDDGDDDDVDVDDDGDDDDVDDDDFDDDDGDGDGDDDVLSIHAERAALAPQISTWPHCLANQEGLESPLAMALDDTLIDQTV